MTEHTDATGAHPWEYPPNSINPADCKPDKVYRVQFKDDDWDFDLPAAEAAKDVPVHTARRVITRFGPEWFVTDADRWTYKDDELVVLGEVADEDTSPRVPSADIAATDTTLTWESKPIAEGVDELRIEVSWGVWPYRILGYRDQAIVEKFTPSLPHEFVHRRPEEAFEDMMRRARQVAEAWEHDEKSP
ncbi:hypothetical protein [Mycobacteroides chelonae]|uniref:hypothetical protein n=1 Tax=Mycobacteroides chelonae TaxID=1774 RepID=UPI0008AA0B14|nr:hypothetical protein [Mycobacteroides chelonae]OHU12786.1 hypothetical protein BKG75_17365 [Mycobacteroides chelonae]